MSSETSELKSETESETVLESETKKTMASKYNEIDISLSTPLSLPNPPLINWKWQIEDMVFPEELPKELNILFDIVPLKLFEIFFDDVIINFIIKITNLYAQQDNDKVNFTTAPFEIKVYLSTLILSGYAIKHIAKTNQMFIAHQCQKQCHEITKSF